MGICNVYVVIILSIAVLNIGEETALRKESLFIKSSMVILMVLQYLLATATLIVWADYQKVPPFFFVVAMFLVVLVPTMLFKRCNIAGIFRMTYIYFAFIPTMNMRMLCDLPQRTDLFHVDVNVRSALAYMGGFSRAIIGLIIFFGCILVLKGQAWKKSYTITVCGAIFLGVLMLVLPGLSEILLYCMTYLLILLVFIMWEKRMTLPIEKSENILMWGLQLVVWAHGCFRCLLILQAYWPQG